MKRRSISGRKRTEMKGTEAEEKWDSDAESSKSTNRSWKRLF
jgi:hypothetical protein